jgi:hypothetical protein
MSHRTNEPRRVKRQDSDNQTARDAQRADRDRMWSEAMTRRRS